MKTKKHIHKDPIPFPKVATVYENRFIDAYSKMQKQMTKQVLEKFINFVNK